MLSLLLLKLTWHGCVNSNALHHLSDWQFEMANELLLHALHGEGGGGGVAVLLDDLDLRPDIAQAQAAHPLTTEQNNSPSRVGGNAYPGIIMYFQDLLCIFQDLDVKNDARYFLASSLAARKKRRSGVPWKALKCSRSEFSKYLW